MTDFEFTNQLSRVIAVFGKVHFAEERNKIIWGLSRDLSEESFSQICTHFISSLKSAPLPQDFAKAIHEERKAKWQQEAAGREIERDWKNAPIECQECFETGFVLCLESVTKAMILMRCECAHGGNAYSEIIPQWCAEIGGLMLKQPFPAKSFIPDLEEKEAPVKVRKGKLILSPKCQKIMERWRARIKFSEDYWKHQIEKHKGELG